MDTFLAVEEDISEYERERDKPMPSFGRSRLEQPLIAHLLQYEPHIHKGNDGIVA
jgi:hypothetical protein